MEKQAGKVTKFFPKISVAVVEPTEEIKKGDKIVIRGSNNVEQTIDSMEINHEKIETAKAGDSFGMKTADVVKEGDIVYLVEGEEGQAAEEGTAAETEEKKEE